MNNRTRQWFKANKMLDKYDPPIIALVRDPESGKKHVLIIRQSELETVREIYGDCLEEWN